MASTTGIAAAAAVSLTTASGAYLTMVSSYCAIAVLASSTYISSPTKCGKEEPFCVISSTSPNLTYCPTSSARIFGVRA